jgi:hypothetical protein
VYCFDGLGVCWFDASGVEVVSDGGMSSTLLRICSVHQEVVRWPQCWTE